MPRFNGEKDMSQPKPNPLNLLTLPPLQRKIVTYLMRNGPTDPVVLIEVLAKDQNDPGQALDHLVAAGHIFLSETGQADIQLGRTRRRKLPGRLWPALFASSRLYSIREIATLRTVIPILQFARAKLSEFADHGPNHVLRVKSFATQLGCIMGLTSTEQHLLRAGALFHDVGNVVDRHRHHIVSQETVIRLTDQGDLPFSAREAELVGLLCRWHRREYDPQRIDEIQGERIRTGLLASILRVADAMDIDYNRSDYSDQFSWVLHFFYPEEVPYWRSLEEILGVRIHADPNLTLQVFTDRQITDNIQINMLCEDLASTPLPGQVQQVAVGSELSDSPTKPGRQGLARLIFPFDPHSLIMAALSRKHLRQAGYEVGLLCYPDTADSPAWLWGVALSPNPMDDVARLVIINDRPRPLLDDTVAETVAQWQSQGTVVTLLNRHEANWSRLARLRELDVDQQRVEVILGGDWAYFWGSQVTQAEVRWGRVAALCTRDPIQSTVGLTQTDEQLTQGLLKTVYDAASQTQVDEVDWVALAEPILTRIEADDRPYFMDRAVDFLTTYGAGLIVTHIEGQVLRGRGSTQMEVPQAYFWALETAIEQQGRRPERGIRFNTPYALLTWSNEETVELLAISHWRDEGAIPIRLLYPTDLGPPPEGNESGLRVRLPADQAEAIIRALIENCNHT